jgi:2-C-methyl-D-erythritol 4-phosphate cytidylyltransferase
MNIAVIFAGGFGMRMNDESCPKQFLEFRDKPLIIYTLEQFDRHPWIDGISIACLEDWIPYLQDLLLKFDVKKVLRIVPGGATGQDSIYNGLLAAQEISSDENDIVLIHDGVRPFITAQAISDNILKVKEEGACITCARATETFLVGHNGDHFLLPSREDSLLARAPQSFFLKDILAGHKKAIKDGLHNFIDSCSLMDYYGYNLATVMGPVENIKITTPLDFFLFKAIIQMRDEELPLGI